MSYWLDEGTTNKKVDKRKGPDGLTKFTRFASFSTWLLLFISVVVTDAARPETLHIGVLDNKYGKISSGNWDNNLILIGMFICFSAIIMSLIGLLVNSQRLQRKTDHFSTALMIGLLLSIVGSGAFIIFYML